MCVSYMLKMKHAALTALPDMTYCRSQPQKGVMQKEVICRAEKTGQKEVDKKREIKEAVCELYLRSFMRTYSIHVLFLLLMPQTL